MSLTTYDGLKTSIAGWLKRSDMTSIIPDLIVLAESRIARDLRLSRQITAGNIALTAGVQSAALPADWLEFDGLVLTGNPERRLPFVPTEHLNIKYPSSYSGQPVVYSIEGAQLLVGPTPDAAYTIATTYYAKFPALSAPADTNWLLTNHPAIYLFASLAEAEPWAHNDQRAGMWEAKYAKELNDLQTADRDAMFSGSAIRVKTIN